MQDIIKDSIIFALSHLPLIMLALAILISLTVISRRGEHGGPLQNIDTLIAYIMLLVVGVSGIWGFIMHGFFPDQASKFIGWKPSPFEFEVAVANLGLGVTGLLSFKASKGFRLATTIFVMCFFWGAAVGHIHQMLGYHNFHAGNAGAIFYLDIFLPILLITLLVIHSVKAKRVFR